MEDLTPHENKLTHKIEDNNYTFRENGCGLGNNMYVQNDIHPTAIIGEEVVMGVGNKIGAYAVIQGKTIIGDNNVFKPFCSIGGEPEHKSFFDKPNKGTVIGNDNHFCEYVTINAGCFNATTLGNNIVMLRGSHVGHDSVIYSGCTISCNVLIGGHSLLGYGVNMGLGSICHQYSKIGSYAMIGMGAIITKKTHPNCFGMYVGNPAKYIKQNDFVKSKMTYEFVQDTCQEFEKLIETHFPDEPF
jgi:UDP-N-acetylglucosamine acyltransferase